MKQIILVLLSVGLFSSCASAMPVVTPTWAVASPTTSAPTRTPHYAPVSTTAPSPIPTVTPAPTLVPAQPLTSHTWTPSRVLITYDQDWYGFCSTVCPPYAAPLVLYGDGNFYLRVSADIDGNLRVRYLHKRFDRHEICRILNTIDQTGFFDFDPSTYSVSRIYDAPNWRVQVHAWRQKDVTLYALGDAVDFLNLDPSLVPADEIRPASLRNTFTLLYNYPRDGLTMSIPRSLAVWIWKSSFEDAPVQTWTVEGLSLAHLYQQAGSAVDTLPQPIYLTGTDAKRVYAMFDNFDYYGDVLENGERYSMYIRPVLPGEKIRGATSVISPRENDIRLPASMYCSPLDGTMPIPPFGLERQEGA